MTLQPMTQSRLRTWRKCARKHALRYVEGWAPAEKPEALRYGTLVHAAIEAFWRGQDWRAALAAEVYKSDPVMVAKAQCVMEAYELAWSDRDDFEVLAVEAEFVTPIINPETMRASQTYELRGKIDLILRRKATGETILVEHKSTSEDFHDDAATYWTRIAMDTQLSLYVVGAESLGYQVDRIIYDVVSRPRHAPLSATPEDKRKYTKAGKLYAAQRDTDETIPEFAKRLREVIAEEPSKHARRREFVRMDNELREALSDLWHETRMIREAELAGRAPRNPDACHQFGTCDYYAICALGADPEASTQFRRLDDVNPELAGEQDNGVQGSPCLASPASTLETIK